MVNEKKVLGKILTVDLYNCDKNIISDINQVEEIMLQTAKDINATIISTDFLHWNPYGISGVIIIAESHIAIHTWEEYNFASIDLYTCDLSMDLKKATELFKKRFKSDKFEIMMKERGIILPE
jgi:S-adenosylmethionine decarboxylase proenzyme